MESLGAFKSVLRVRKILASWIQIRIWKNMLIQGAKYQQKNAKKFTLKPQIWAIEKRAIIKISWFLNGSLL